MRDSSLEELMGGTRQEPAPENAGRHLVMGAATPPAVRTIRRLVAALAAVGLVAVAALAASVWQLTRPAARTVVTVSERVAPAPPRAPPVTTVQHRVVAARLVLTAARGACWLEVRTAGKVLYAGTLDQGRTVTFTRRRLRVAYGAGGNLDARLNGRAVRFPSGTAAVTVTARGIV